MSEQPSLLAWQPPRARLTDCETSVAAARDAYIRASEGRLLVLRNLTVRAMTDFELASLTGWAQTSIGKRRGECCDHGLVEVALDGHGEVVKRPAPSGSMARVWSITADGRAFLEKQARGIAA
jgi:hypothetical protein